MKISEKQIMQLISQIENFITHLRELKLMDEISESGLEDLTDCCLLINDIVNQQSDEKKEIT